jgi:cytochrome c oxidase subunit 3
LRAVANAVRGSAGAHVSTHVEAEHEHHGPAEYTFQPNPFKLDPTTLGLVIFLTSEIALFGAFFLFYGHTRLIKHLEWPQPGFDIPADATSFNTAILVASSFTCEMVLLLLVRNMRRAAIAWMVLTILLGSAFLGLQVREYMNIGFTPQTNSMGSTFFSLTGLHGAHVFIGINLLLYCLIRLMRGHFSKDGGMVGLVITSIYWHFVDVVWIVLYTLVYLLPTHVT